MKNFTLILSCLLFTAYTLQGQVFVNQNANGTNDGSSWTNAYTNLNDAINAAPANAQLWIAAGTYKPGTTTTDAFKPSNSLEFYGGFSGTETMLSQRDVSANSTILSGDLLGDDVLDDFTTNRADNTLHIFWLEIGVDGVFDGLIFEGGQTADASGSGDDRRGGAILSYGKLKVQNCIFRQNYGYYGGGMYPRQAGANGTEIIDCMFMNNSGGFGAGVFMASTQGTIENCTFTNNEVTGNGGAFCATNTTYTVQSTEFIDNFAVEGGAILTNSSQGGTHVCAINDCTFTGNMGTYGGAVESYNLGITINYNNCVFNNNEASYNGGAVAAEFQSTGNLKNCTFNDNKSQFGGAVSMYDGALVTIEEGIFNDNIAEPAVNGTGGLGGAIANLSPSLLRVIKSDFTGNSALHGGAIHSENNSEGNIVEVTGSTLLSNGASAIGGGINTLNSMVSITNCLIAKNTGVVTGGAAAFRTNGLDGKTTIINSTIAENTSNAADGVALIVNLNENLELVLQNTILDNTDQNFINQAVSGTLGIVSSLGGNLSSDASLTDDLQGMNDIHSVAPQFVDAAAGDYHLTSASPCINQGILNGAPATDIEGKPRINNPEMGAYEFDGVLSSTAAALDPLQFSVFPNPAEEFVYFSLPSDWVGEVLVQLTDAKGAILQKSIQNIRSESTLNVSELPTGIYYLHLTSGAASHSVSFLKK